MFKVKVLKDYKNFKKGQKVWCYNSFWIYRPDKKIDILMFLLWDSKVKKWLLLSDEYIGGIK